MLGPFIQVIFVTHHATDGYQIEHDGLCTTVNTNFEQFSRK